MKLIIHAPNVHQGGGSSLLSALLRVVARNSEVSVLIDSRFKVPAGLPAHNIDMRVPPTIWGRLRAEKRLRMLADAGTKVLCFGNLPPLFKCRGQVLLFLQNRYLTGGLNPSGFSLRTRLRIAGERTWLRSRIGNVYQVVVQSPSMAKEAEQVLGLRPRVLGFVPDMPRRGDAGSIVSSTKEYQFDFIYVASGEPHKNHRVLIEAWSLLASEGIKPSLCITLDPRLYPGLVAWIKEKSLAEALQVENIGVVPAEELDGHYCNSRALIYPSLGESLGLPLLETRGNCLPIIAAELDYVRDVIEPVETFDPRSPLSIARAVKRFLGVSCSPIQMLTPEQFLDAILAG